MNTKERILQYLEFKDISRGKFCRKIGVSNGFLSSGKHIGSEKLKIIRDNYADLNMDWLIYDEGEMIIQDNLLNERKHIYKKSTSISRELLVALEKDNLKDIFELFMEEYGLLQKKQAVTERTLSDLALDIETLEKRVSKILKKG